MRLFTLEQTVRVCTVTLSLTGQYLSVCLCVPGLGPGPGWPVFPNLAVAIGGGRCVQGAVLRVLRVLPEPGHVVTPVVTQPLHVPLQQLSHRGVVVTERHSVGVTSVVILNKVYVLL